MKPQVYYETVSEAIRKLREKGFTKDFNLEENCITCHPDKFFAEDFDIVEIYRYEGNTDPADEATVYGIASRSGIKGILVTGYGASGDIMSEEILEKLRIRR
ncbi:MAG TPA: hypothetical protein VI603_13950 [Saprospiraceae bacterium]|nr:hypothetical protein [Saprospiraceae bacterium]